MGECTELLQLCADFCFHLVWSVRGHPIPLIFFFLPFRSHKTTKPFANEIQPVNFPLFFFHNFFFCLLVYFLLKDNCFTFNILDEK